VLLSQQPGCFLALSLSPMRKPRTSTKPKGHVHGARWKKNSWPRFTSADVQKKSDADSGIHQDGKLPRCPSTGKLKRKRLRAVAYIGR